MIKPSNFKNIQKYLFLHFCILIYTATSILSKFAAGFDFLSIPYIACMGGIVVSLGVYALLWQQAIKPFSPSVAYSNKSVTTIWVMIFSALIFGEGITLCNVIGTIMIIAGVILVAQEDD